MQLYIFESSLVRILRDEFFNRSIAESLARRIMDHVASHAPYESITEQDLLRIKALYKALGLLIEELEKTER